MRRVLRLHAIVLSLGLILSWSTLATAQTCTGCPYEYSSLGTVSFNSSTYEQYGVAGGGSSGADIWAMSWAGDGNVYAHWGDGAGWNQSMSYSSFGWTRITDDPPTMAATDVSGDSAIEWKPSGFVADASSVHRGFYGIGTDNFKSSYVMTSSNEGTTYTRSGTKIFDQAIDGVVVVSMAQAGQGYTGTLPGDVDDAYYYIYLGGIWAQHGEAPNPPYDDLYLARVIKADIAVKANYEYVTAVNGSGVPTWGTFANKIPIFTDPNGWDYLVGVTYWPSIDKWILAKAHGVSKLGIFEADTPWGGNSGTSWKTLYYGDFRDSLRKFTYYTPQKWMSASAPNTFWMAFSGWPEYDNVSFIQGTITATDSIAPKPPTNLQVTTISATELQVSWTAPSQNADNSALTDLAGYRITFGTGVSCTPDTVITPDLGTVTSFSHTGLTIGTNYCYTIQSKDTTGNLSSASDEVEGPTASEETLAMAATSNPNNWTLGAGADKVAAVAANDGSTTYIVSSTNAQQQQYTIANPAGIAAADSIANVRLRAGATKIPTQGVSLVLTAVLGGDTLANTCALTQNTYTDCVLSMPTKPGGGAWSLADVQNLEARVQPNASRETRVTHIDVLVSSVPDPAPKPPTAPTASAANATTVNLGWTLPTQNTDNSPLTDLTALRVIYCTGTSCIPSTTITPDLAASATTYQHLGLTTGTSYGYSVRAIDSTGKLSQLSSIVSATPTADPPDLVGGDWRFHEVGQASVLKLADANTTIRVRRNGQVRLRLQMSNAGPGATRTYPIECNKDGGSYQELTTTCGAFGVCLRNNGGATHGSATQQVLTLPVGISSYAGGVFINNATWPTVEVPNDYASEMEYDLAIEGLTDEEVCCRIEGLDSYSAGSACFTAFAGSARKG